MPNAFAWLTLWATPLFCFYAVKKWPPLKAALIVIVGGAMFLPSHTAFDVPILPALNKDVLPSLSLLVAFLIARPEALRVPWFRGPDSLLIPAAIGAMVTALTNGDPIVHGPRTIPGQTFYDGFIDLVGVLAYWFPAFYMGRALVRTQRDLMYLIRFMVLATLVYTIPIMIELRLSPQMHNWFYGFHQTQFLQTIRYGGYRPKVFMRHGLNVALFMTVGALLAVMLWRAKKQLHAFWTPGRASLFLLVIVILCKSTGAYFHLVLLLPLIAFASVKTQVRVSLAFCVVVIAYPLLRLNDWIPVQGITDWMEQNVNAERAKSLWFRLHTEGEVLERARERFLFGWGGYGRPYIFDNVTGRQISILDGYWAIELGNRGLVGFLCIFGMMCWPVIATTRKIDQILDPTNQRIAAGLCLICTLYVFDWLPNSSISMELTFLVGGLSGALQALTQERRTDASTPASSVRSQRKRRRARMPAFADDAA